MDDFLKGEGPARLFFFYQIPYKITDTQEVKEIGTHEELSMGYGTNIFVYIHLPPEYAIDLLHIQQ